MSLKKNKAVDVVVVGMGWSGGIIAKELAEAGLTVVGLERGADRSLKRDFSSPATRDELKFAVRTELMQDVAKETITFRNQPDQEALPMRRLGSFLPGEGTGGSGLIWNGWTLRQFPYEFPLRTHLENRYGKAAIPAYMSIQDWPITYDELEPYYDKFEYTCAVSGEAGVNPFEGPRSRGYPNPPLKTSYAYTVFNECATQLGYHPYSLPTANSSRPYVNPDGEAFGTCQYCGHCDRFACVASAKASPNLTVIASARKSSNFKLLPHAYVTRVNLDSTGKKATGVTYVDGISGQEIEQPAALVILASHTLSNVQLLLHSRIGKPYDPTSGEGNVGRNYTYRVIGAVTCFFEDKIFNPFMGAGGLTCGIDDFNTDNFDHTGLGFLGGGWIGAVSWGARPILERYSLPKGVPRWGSAWKKATAKWYLRTMPIVFQACNYASRLNYLDLDPVYKNAFGQPLLRMTYNFTDNDRKMQRYLRGIAAGIGRAAKADHLVEYGFGEDYSIERYQSTHLSGGAIMGTSPTDSVVNKYCQSWDVPNVFVVGGSAFPQKGGNNPTATIGALSYYVADAIKTRFVMGEGALL